MNTATKKFLDRKNAGQRVRDAQLLRDSGVHKLMIADREGNCIAFLLAWNGFGYDAATDTYVCVADTDGQELMTLYTEGEVRSQPGTDMYVVTAPYAEPVLTVAAQ